MHSDSLTPDTATQSPSRKKAKRTPKVPLTELVVLKCPPFRTTWVPQGANTSMTLVQNAITVAFLNSFNPPLEARTIYFDEIPEKNFDAYGNCRSRFLVACKNKRNEQGVFMPMFFVLPSLNKSRCSSSHQTRSGIT